MEIQNFYATANRKDLANTRQFFVCIIRYQISYTDNINLYNIDLIIVVTYLMSNWNYFTQVWIDKLLHYTAKYIEKHDSKFRFIIQNIWVNGNNYVLENFTGAIE